MVPASRPWRVAGGSQSVAGEQEGNKERVLVANGRVEGKKAKGPDSMDTRGSPGSRMGHSLKDS